MSLKADDLPSNINAENIEVRDYQVELYKESLKGNSLIVLPTGLGKSLIAVLVAAHKLEESALCKIVAMAPTKPLVNQLLNSFKRTIHLERGLIASLTGDDTPEKRIEIWRNSCIIVSTPQVIKNDLLASRYSLKEVCLTIFDEAHRATGDYPYVYIAKKYLEENPNGHIIGLTASPGYSDEQIRELRANLGVTFVHFKDRDDPDVKRYVQRVNEETLMIEPPVEFTSVLKYFNILLEKYVKPLKEASLIGYKDARALSLKKIIELQKTLSQRVAKEGLSAEYINYTILVTNAIRVSHAITLLETQGVTSTLMYIRRVEEAAGRRMNSSLKMLVRDPFWLTARIQLESLSQAGLEHPKLLRLRELLKEHFESGGQRALVFTNYRDTAKLIVQTLLGESIIRPARFVGQADRGGDRGLTQKDQIEILRKFRDGEYNVLVATQVAEEGLDIAECDFVVMYDNVPSPLRLIQRIGRTGRISAGRIVYLVTRHTRDEVYHYIAKRRRRDVVNAIKNDVNNPPTPISSRPTQDTMYTGIEVAADVRETNSEVAVYLSNLGVKLKLTKLNVSDYVVSDDICVERKTVDDFTASVVDGRLFDQALKMRRTYRKPILIVEGENIYSSRLNPESIRGALISLAVDYGIPILWSRSANETAHLIARMAAREQREAGSRPIIRDSRKPVNDEQIKEFIVASLPGVDAVRARSLLRHFGSVLRVFTATMEELESVEGIGRKTAEKIRRILEEEYRQEQST
ncbi:MAG TPA: ERCC4 domain-containing protein [bacterium]|nr:ERCC4 domain-containing protein [bacterium]